MKSDAWLPTDERMAASGLAAFIEWLRASGRMMTADPVSVLAWARTRNAAFDAAMTAFMGWDDAGPRIAPQRGAREAIVRYSGGQRQAWTYDGLPASVLAALAQADAVGLAAFHLLERDVHPDERVLWAGPPDDPLPLGVLYIGATVIFGGDAAAEGARLL